MKKITKVQYKAKREALSYYLGSTCIKLNSIDEAIDKAKELIKKSSFKTNPVVFSAEWVKNNCKECMPANQVDLNKFDTCYKYNDNISVVISDGDNDVFCFQFIYHIN